MSSSTDHHPFERLRQLLGELRMIRGGSSTEGAADRRRSELFEELEQWIQFAQLRKQRSEAIIDAGLDALVSIDADGRVVDWNRQATRSFGWSRSEAFGRPLTELIVPPAHREAHSRGLRRFLETGEGPVLNRRLELTAVRKDGVEFPIELTVLDPISIAGSYVFSAFVRDISERKRSIEALRDSEALYHSLVDNLPINVTRKDLEGRITFVNKPFCDLMGKPPEQLLGRTDHDFFPPELAAKYREDDRRVASTSEVFQDIEENRVGDRTRSFEVKKTPVRNADGEVIETQAIFWDVTDRVEAREALARERDLLRTLMDHLPDFVYVKDAGSRYVTVNAAQARMLGAPSPDEVEGRSNFDFYPPEQARRHVEDDRHVMESGEPLIDREEQVLDRVGNEIWLLSSKVPFRSRDGTMLGVVGVDRNITQRKRVEDELKRSNRELDQFVAVVSHDLHAPMRAVETFCRLLRDEYRSRLDGNAVEYVDQILGGAKRMQRLIDDLRAYARVTGQTKPHEPTDCEKALRLAVANLDAEINERRARITNDPLPTIQGDATQMMQLFQNLIGNAVKYCREGPPRVHVGAQRRDAEWLFSVRDNGIGIDPGRTQDVFRLFQRLHADDVEFTGTGIGLAVCQRIVQRHRGRIWVDSEPGQGSTFYFSVGDPAA